MKHCIPYNPVAQTTIAHVIVALSLLLQITSITLVK